MAHGSYRAHNRFKAGEEPEIPAGSDDPAHYSNQIQAIADPGDLLVVNSAGLHTAGTNRTQTPRRTLNIRVVQPDGPLFYNAWELAGPIRQSRTSARVKRFMQPPADCTTELRTDWPVMPRQDTATA